jgi:hypothetical protein
MKTVKPIAMLLSIPLSGCFIGYIGNEVYENRMKEEKRQVVNFVKNNKELIREVHNIKNVQVLTWSSKNGENYPFRYAVSVSGDKSTDAVLDVVSRSFGIISVQFALACFGHFPRQEDEAQYDCKHVQLDDVSEREAVKAIEIAYPGILQNAYWVAAMTTLGSDVNGFASKGEKVWHVRIICDKTKTYYARFFAHPQSGAIFSILKPGEKIPKSADKACIASETRGERTVFDATTRWRERPLWVVSRRVRNRPEATCADARKHANFARS